MWLKVIHLFYICMNKYDQNTRKKKNHENENKILSEFLQVCGNRGGRGQATISHYG